MPGLSDLVFGDLVPKPEPAPAPARRLTEAVFGDLSPAALEVRPSPSETVFGDTDPAELQAAQVEADTAPPEPAAPPPPPAAPPAPPPPPAAAPAPGEVDSWLDRLGTRYPQLGGPDLASVPRRAGPLRDWYARARAVVAETDRPTASGEVGDLVRQRVLARLADRYRAPELLKLGPAPVVLAAIDWLRTGDVPPPTIAELVGRVRDVLSRSDVLAAERGRGQAGDWIAEGPPLDGVRREALAELRTGLTNAARLLALHERGLADYTTIRQLPDHLLFSTDENALLDPVRIAPNLPVIQEAGREGTAMRPWDALAYGAAAEARTLALSAEDELLVQRRALERVGLRDLDPALLPYVQGAARWLHTRTEVAAGGPGGPGGLARQEVLAVRPGTPEALRPAAEALARGLTPAALRELAAAQEAARANLRTLRALQTRGLADADAVERVGARLTEPDARAVLDPALVARTVPLAQAAPVYVADIPDLPSDPGRRLAALAGLAEAQAQAAADRARMTARAAFQELVGTVMAPLGWAMRQLDSGSVLLIGLARRLAGQEPLDEATIRGLGATHFARASAAFAELIKDQALADEIWRRVLQVERRGEVARPEDVAYLQEVSSWHNVFERVRQRVGLDDWVEHVNWQPAKNFIATAIEVLDMVGPGIVTSVLPNTWAEIPTRLGLTTAPLLQTQLAPTLVRHFPQLAKRLQVTLTEVDGRLRAAFNAAAHPRLTRELRSLANRLQFRPEGYRELVDEGLLRLVREAPVALRSVAAELRGRSWWSRFFGHELYNARKAEALADLVERVSVVTSHTDDAGRLLATIAPEPFLRAIDPYGMATLALGRRLVSASALQAAAERAQSVAQQIAQGAAPEGAEVAGFRFADYAAQQLIADYGMTVAINGGMMVRLYQIVLDYMQHKIRRMRREQIPAQETITAELRRFRRVGHEYRALRDTLADPIGVLRGVRLGKAFLESVDDDLCRVIATFDAKFRERYEAARDQALTEFMKRAQRPALRELRKLERFREELRSRQERTARLLENIRPLVEGGPRIPRAAPEEIAAGARRAALLERELPGVLQQMEAAADAIQYGKTAAIRAAAERRLYRLADRVARLRAGRAAAEEAVRTGVAGVRATEAAGREASRRLRRVPRLVALERLEASLEARLRDIEGLATDLKTHLEKARTDATAAALVDEGFLALLRRELARAFRLPAAQPEIRGAVAGAVQQARAMGSRALGVPDMFGSARSTMRQIIDAARCRVAEIDARVTEILGRIEDLRERAPRLYEALDRTLQERGIDPDVMSRRLTEVVRDHFPEVFDRVEQARGILRDLLTENVEHLVALRNAGQISENMFNELLRFYRPTRPRLALAEATTEARTVAESRALTRSRIMERAHVIAGTGPGGKDWRVIYESGTQRRTRYFASEEAAKNFLRGNGLRGEILPPIEDTLKLLEYDEVVARIRAMRDLAEYRAWTDMQNAIAHLSGLCIDDARAALLSPQLKFGPGAEWVQLPKNARLGPLSGRWLHKSVLKTAAAYSRVSSFVRGWSNQLLDELAHESGPMGQLSDVLRVQSVARWFGLNTPNLARWSVAAWKKLALSSWITMSPIVMATNAVFNVVTAMLGLDIGPSALLSKSFWRGVADAWRGGRRSQLLAREGLLLEGGGLRTGAGAAVERRLAALSGTRTWRELRAEWRRLEAVDPLTLEPAQQVARQRAMMAIEEEVGRSFPQMLQRRLARAFGATGQALHDAYESIDRAMRAGYANVLVERGYSPAEAARRVNLFMQDYARVAPAIRGLSQTFTGSWVPSFPAEYFRLLKNLFLYKPTNLVLMGAGMHLLNSTTLAADGKSVEQWMRARGRRNGVAQLAAYLGTLHLPGGWDVDLGNLSGMSTIFMPIGLLRPIGLQAWREDSAAGAVVGILASIAGRFVLNNPAAAGLLVVGGGRDSFTGRRLVDPDAGLGGQIAAMTQWWLRTSLPAWVPGTGGYVGEELNKAWDTNKARRRSVIERMLAVVGTRQYTGPDALANLIADARRLQIQGGEFETALWGETKEMYDAIAEWCARYAERPGDETVEAALADLRARLGRPHTQFVGGRPVELRRSEAEIDAVIRRLAKSDPLGRYSELPIAQRAFVYADAVVLGLDRDPQIGSRLLGLLLDGREAYVAPDTLQRRLLARATPETRTGGARGRRDPLAQLDADELRDALRFLRTALNRRPDHRGLRLAIAEIDAALERAESREER